MSVTASPASFFLLALAVERDVLQEGLQPVGRRVAGPAKIVERGGQFAQVADAVLGVLGDFFPTAAVRRNSRSRPGNVGPGLQRRAAARGPPALIGQLRARVCSINSNKRLDALARLGLKGHLHRRIFHRGEHGALALVARGQQAFHGHVAQPARRHVGNAQQADVVVRIDEDLQVGEKIADFSRRSKKLWPPMR